MAINDRFMLPKRVRTMEQMADLLAAEQAELDQTQRTITALENQLTINTSTHLLPRHERLFALPVNTTESLEVRRARVLAKLNTRGTTTVRAIRDMVEIITGREGDVIEHFEDYAFSVLIKLLPADATTDVQELIRQIEEIKPAHLLFDIIAAFRPTPLVHENRLVFHRLAIRFSASNSRGTPFIRFDGSVHFDGSSQFNQAPDGISLWRAAFRTSFSNREAVTGMVTIDDWCAFDGTITFSGTRKFNAQHTQEEL